MIQSMTAFARTQAQGKWGSVVCECRSINHRYLEISMKVPEPLHALEALMRERVRHHVKRGKVECLLRYQPAENGDTDFSLNEVLLTKLSHAHALVSQHIPNPAPVNTMEVLRWPGILKMTEIDLDKIQAEVLQALDKTLIDLVEARQREGQTLRELFYLRLDNMAEELAKVRLRLPAILHSQRERLVARFTEASVQFDASRLEQELVIYAQKIDVTEELERLDTHIAEVRRILVKGEAMGRRLDFLMQELNREANTLGSKSVDSDTTHASVELKVLIEQMREQVQNVE